MDSELERKAPWLAHQLAREGARLIPGYARTTKAMLYQRLRVILSYGIVSHKLALSLALRRTFIHSTFR